MSTGMIERLLSRAKEQGLSPRGLSLKAGLGPTTVRDIVQRPGASPRTETVRKLAEALATTPEWLSYGVDGAPDAAAESLPAQTRDSGTGSSALRDTVVYAEFAGTLQAGSFREVEEYDDIARERVPVPRDDRFPRHKHVVFDVAGDSMNAADPPLVEGSQVVVIAADNPEHPVSLRNGDFVVVQRSRAQGGLIERSVKEYERVTGETRYIPRSTNKRHQPIIVPDEPDPDDETIVQVLGLVVGTMNRIRRR